MDAMGEGRQHLGLEAGAYRSQTAANLGYRTVMWTIDTLDWQTDSTPARILQIIKDNLKPGAIILMHAGSVSETQAHDNVITYLQGQGYSLKTISEIIR